MRVVNSTLNSCDLVPPFRPGLAMLDTTFEMDDRSHYGMGNRNGSPDRYFTCKYCQRLFR